MNHGYSGHRVRTAPRRASLSLLLAVAALPGAAWGQSPVGGAQTWLVASQQPSGAFPGAPIVDSAAAWAALPPGAARDAALFAIWLARPDNAEASFSRLAVLQGTSFADFTAAEAHRAAILRGELGLAPGSRGTDLLVLARALAWAARDPQGTDLLPGLLAALDAQTQRGGFTFADNDGDPSVAAELAIALRGVPAGQGIRAAAVAAVVSAAGQAASWPAADVALAILATAGDHPLADQLQPVLAARQSANGSFDGGDVRGTALALQAMRLGLPDLSLRLPAIGVSEAVTGQPLAQSVLVTNIGRAGSPPTSVSYRLTLPGGGELLARTATVPALAPGQSASVALDLGVQGATGERAVLAVLNPGEAFPEGNLDNNVLSYGYRVADLPDLVIEPADIVVLPNPPTLHGTATVAVRVRNIGEAAARNVHLQLLRGEPSSGGTLVAESFLNVVAPGVPRTMMGQLAVSSLEPIRLTARVDPEGTVAEKSRDNNSASTSVQPVSATEVTVDLVARLQVTEPPTVKQGDTLNIGYGLYANAFRWGGLYPFPEFWPFPGVTAVLYEGLPGSGVEVARRYFTKEAAWSTGIDFFAVATSGWQEGTRTYTVVVDPAGEVAEIERSNNVLTKTVSVTTANLPELWIDGLTTDPPAVAPGATFAVRGTLRNTGKARAANIPVRFTFEGIPITTIVAQLDPGGATSLNQLLTAPAGVGNRTITVNVDPASTIAESSKANNGATAQVKVLGADLEIGWMAMSPDPVAVNEPATLTVQLKNVGVTTAPYVSFRVELPAGLAAPLVIAALDSYTYPVPGATATYVIPVPTRRAVGDAAARLVVTPYSTPEVRRDFVLRALNPDFGVSEGAVGFSPANPLPGEAVTPRVVVNNRGTLTAPASVHVYRGYRESNDLATSGTVMVPAGGSAVFVGPTFELQTAPPYVVTIVVDEENTYAEANEADNVTLRNALKGGGEMVVAFDETHDQFPSPYDVTGNWAGGYPDWARDLAARGYTVRSIEPGEGLTPSKLLGVDVVVESLPLRAFSPPERALLSAFLEGGGGVLYLGEWGSTSQPPAWQSAQDDFLPIFGVAPAHVQLASAYPNFLRSAPASGTILEHPITAGLTRVQGNLAGGFSHLPPGAQVLLSSGGYEPKDLPVAAAMGVGSGRVVVIADTQFFDSAALGCVGLNCSFVNYTPDNARFGLQAIDWLAGRGSDAILAPDLQFSPPAIQTPAASVTEGDTVPLALKVRNAGGSAAGATVARLYDGPKGARLLTEWPVPPLAVGEEVELAFEWDTASQAGEHLLTAVVDPDNLVAEFSEDNNAATVAVAASSRADLRVDPSDVSVRPGFPHLVQVRVHNLGVQAVPAGGTLRFTRRIDGLDHPGHPVRLPSVPARGGVTVEVPWIGEFPSSAFDLLVSAQVPAGTIESDPSNDAAAIRFAPPALDVHAPLPGSTWGGMKTLRWSAASESRPSLVVSASIGAPGGAFTGICSKLDGCDLDTRTLASGDYLLRVSASDALQTTIREIPFRIDNSGLAVRTFGAGPGAASASVPAAGGRTAVAIPAGARVESASLLVDAVGATSTVIAPAPSYDTSGGDLLRYRGRLHYFYLQSGMLQWQASADDGATWTAPLALSPPAVRVVGKRAAVNGRGLHLVYQLDGPPRPVYYARSLDGVAFEAALQIGSTTGALHFDFQATDEGLSFAGSYFSLYLAWAAPDGQGWTPLNNIASFQTYYALSAIAGGRLHLVESSGGASPITYRSIRTDEGATRILAAPAATVSDSSAVNTPTPRRLLPLDGALHVLYDYYVPPQEARLQRCSLERDCSLRDSWMPEPITLGSTRPASASVLGPRGTRSLQVVFSDETGLTTANGLDGGRAWSSAYPAVAGTLTAGGWLFEPGVTSRAGYQSTTVFLRSPQLVPQNVTVDLGGDGFSEVAIPGMPGIPLQSDGLADALNAYLASHTDLDDGVADGLVSVPVAVGGAGAGSTLLRNLEVRYRPSSALAGLAIPPLFSPGGSPGALDTTILSLLAAGEIAVMSTTGDVLRNLAAVPAAGRFAGSFDGRGANGALLASGVYGFGKPGAPAGTLEIDDVAPTAVLEASAEGQHGGVVELWGVATDADWAGTSKNFAGYRLEVSTDGAAWRTIAAGSSPTNGLLGRWDTSQVASASATLRLTAFDRAGNSTVDSRTVGVSPGAPMAPVITAPTVAGQPLDSLADALVVAGTAEAGTTVTVFRNGVAVGAVACDGRWSLAGVALPAGISTLSASAARAGLESPRAQAIRVARYALEVSVSAARTSPAGGRFPATILVRRTSVAAGPVRVALDALDSASHPAALGFQPSAVDLALPADGPASFEVQVDAAAVEPGDYRLRARAVSGALLLSQGEALVTLEPLAQVVAALASDRAEYDALQVVALAARLLCSGTGDPGPLEATISVVDPAGGLSLLGPYPIASIPPGAIFSLSALYGAPPMKVGPYAADLEVRDLAGRSVATARTAFSVVPASGTGALAGTLLVNPTSYLRGEALQATFAVSNRGGDAAVAVSVILLSQATSALVARWDGSLPVATGATLPGSAVLSTAGADGHDLVAVLVGNGRALAAQAVAPAVFQDLVPPVITIQGFAAGEVRAGPVTPVVTIADESPFTAVMTLNGAPFSSGTTVSTDGDYSLAVSAEDAWSNRSTAARSFTIDGTAPALAVSGVADGALYAGAVTPVVTATDAHPASPAWSATLNGAAWAGGLVSGEGDWVLEVSATDAPGNAAAPQTIRFAIDATPPTVSVTGVTDGLLTRDAVRPVIAVQDPHPGTVDARLDGAFFTSGTLVTSEGDHLLTVAARDAAGNAAVPVQIHFARDSVPPDVAITGVVQGGIYTYEARPGWVVNDAHPGLVSATLDGAAFTAGTPVRTAGAHTLVVTATDLAGNPTVRSVTFQIVAVQATVTATVDSTSPRVLVVLNCAGQPASCRDSQAKVLLAALAGAGIPHDVALDSATFLAKLREGRHNVRVVYRAGSSATNAYWELRELTFEGGGLLVVNDASPDSDPKLVETLGVSMGAKITSVGTVTFTAGDLGPARSFSVSGSGIAQTLKATTALAPGKASKGTVASTNRYGKGRAVTLTLNPEVNDNASMKDLLVQAVRFAAGGAAVAGVPGAPQYVRMQSALTAPAGPLDFRLDAWTGSGLVPLSDAGLPVAPPRSWTLPLTSAKPELRTLGVVSGQKGTYPVLAELTLLTGGPLLVASGSVDVVVVGSIVEIRQAAISATQAIPTGLDDTARSAALAHLNAVSPAPATKAVCSTAIDQTLQATDDLKLISGTAAADARVKTDQLLRALQALYTTLP